MVDTVGMANSAPTPTTLQFSGRQARQLNGTSLAGATAARPLGVLTGVRPGTPASTVTATSTTWTCQPHAGTADVMVAAESGGYPFAFDAVATGAMTAADASNPRIDIIYDKIVDPEDGSTTPTASRGYLAGTAAAFPSPKPAPAGAFVIAQINVPKVGGGAPTVTWVAPYTVAAGGILPVPAGVYPASPFTGQYVDDPLLGLLRFDGTTWVRMSGLVQISADQPASNLTTGVATTFGSLSLNASLSSPSYASYFAVVTGASGGIKILKAGLYSATIGVNLPSSVGTSRAFVQVGGLATPTWRSKRQPFGPGEDTTSMSVGPMPYAVNDVIAFSAFQATGATITMAGATVTVTYHGQAV